LNFVNQLSLFPWFSLSRQRWVAPPELSTLTFCNHQLPQDGQSGSVATDT
jgi:hypothetical protein